MQVGENPSGTGNDGLHAPFYNRITTRLKSKVCYFSSNPAAPRAAGVPFWKAGFFPPTAFANPGLPIFGKVSVFIGLDSDIP